MSDEPFRTDMRTSRVMIVDDAGDFRSLVRDRLRDEPQLEVVAEAASGAEALAMLTRLDPDVIVLDHGMPVMGGLDVAKEILRRRPDQVIVMLSGEVGDDRRRLASEAGVKACLSKFEIRHLGELILRLVGSNTQGSDF